MGRVCAVKNCKSGGAADMKRRRELNLRKPGFFKVPKSPTIRQKWIDSLSTELSDRQYVCDLHFQNNSIQDCYLTTLPNGKVNKIIKGRLTRTQDSVPLIQQLAISEHQVKPLNAAWDNIELFYEHDQAQQAIKQQIDVDGMRAENPEPINKHLSQRTLVAKRKLNYRDKNITHIKNCEHEMDYNSQINLNNDEEVLSIIIELNKLFPIGWCFIPGINQLIVIQFDCVKLKERVRLIVDDDQSVLVTFFEQYKKKVLTQIKSVNDLINCLKYMELKKLCTGTGFHTKRNSYSLKCHGDVSDMYKRCQACPRCPECQKLRLKLLKLKKARKSHIVDKTTQVTSKDINLGLGKKNKRIKQQV